MVLVGLGASMQQCKWLLSWLVLVEMMSLKKKTFEKVFEARKKLQESEGQLLARRRSNESLGAKERDRKSKIENLMK